MERVYLLLRNNQQSGPFTIGELLQQQLSASDMIWIEGKSTAWTYLSELELNPLIKNMETSEHGKKASDEIEQKAEELRQRILSAPPRTYFADRSVELETYASPYKMEDGVQFVDHRKERRIKKNTALGELLLTCFVICIFMIGIFKGKSFLGARNKVQNSVATQLDSGDQHAAKKSTTANQITFAIDTVKHADSLSAMQKNKRKIGAGKKAFTDSVNAASIQSAATVINENNKKEEPVVQLPPRVTPEKNNVKKDEDTPVKKETVASIPQVKNSIEPAKEEKRGFLRGLFKKKKNKEE